MKHSVNVFILLLLIPSLAGAVRSSAGQGFGPYEIKPFNINGNVNLAIPFLTKNATTCTYSYQVVNAKSHIIFTSGVIEQRYFPSSTNYITYSAKPGVTSAGENTMIIKWRTTETGIDALHFVYFYGYNSELVINLNNETELRNFENAETTYRYSGYEDNSSQKVKTTLSAPIFSGSAYFVHDLYFDFSALLFTSNRVYSERLYESATLYTKDLTIFPRLSRLGVESVIPLKLSEEGGQINFIPNFSLYVDKETFIVAQYAYPGLIPASRLYFPKGRMGELNLTKFRLEIKGFGYLKATLNLDFYLEIGATFLGQGGIHEAQIERY